MKYIWITLGVLIGLAALIYIIGLMLPVSHTASVSKEINAPKEVVWKYVTLPQKFPEWRSAVNRVEMLSDSTQPLRWTEFYDGMDALTFQESSRSDSSVFVSDIVSEGLPFGGGWTISLQQNENGTIVTITENGEIYNPVFRFFSRFIFGYDGTIQQYLNDLETAV